MSGQQDIGHPADAPARRRRLKTVLLGLAILFFGMIIGGGITLHIGHVMILHTLNPGDEMAEHIGRRIDRKLDLSADQRSRVDAIVRRRVAAFREILDDAYPRILEQIRLMHDEVARVLTEEQRMEWNAHVEEMRRRLERHKPSSSTFSSSDSFRLGKGAGADSP